LSSIIYCKHFFQTLAPAAIGCKPVAQPAPSGDDRNPAFGNISALADTTKHCHPERSEGPALADTTKHCHPERSEGPALADTTKHCHPERSEGPAFGRTIHTLASLLFTV
jgi:hypothetical protein